ncbi:hypothetical protein L2E82_21784 [Cichorium intybus]|uniref:Uncharacterized protein n=1 Tax=Cichorium intybus TaxID=13427 RepID=A0ACB9DW71_CICIN|nr:hypothetical protein L2E82_21784 [Cichorium intybus]
MASSDQPPFLSSPPSSTEDLEQWLIDIPQTLESLLYSETTLPICIFKLQETRTSEKPDAYVPQHIGLGPIHHFRTDIYSKQEKLKLVKANKIIRNYITSEFEKIVQESLIDLVPVAEYCYDLQFDIENDVLAWVFAIDAVVVLGILSTVSDGHRTEYLEDVMMVENQIPLVVLVNLLNALDEHLDGGGPDLTYLLVDFCNKRSPLEFIIAKTPLDLYTEDRFHLLDCMYHLIVNHTVPEMDQAHGAAAITKEDVENIVQTTGALFPSLNVFFQPILVILKLPWDKIGALIKPLVGETPVVLEIDIPSASRLARTAKIEFSTTTGGIHDIEFDEKKLTFCLPVLNLKSDSEVILRNLVAYEELLFKNGTVTNLAFTEYVDFMCGIVDGVKDVKLLQEKKIILGDMKDEEIVKLFNGITKSSAKVGRGESKLLKTIEKNNLGLGNVRLVIPYVTRNTKLYDF